MYPVIPEKYGDRGWDDFLNDEYGYYEDFDGRSRSSEYDDPRDYREWDDWSDADNDEQYWGPFPEEGGGDSILTSCAPVLAVDETAIVADSYSGDPQTRSLLNGPEFHCNPDSDRMLGRQWFHLALDTLVRETGVTVRSLDIPADINSDSHISFIPVLHDYCTPDLGKYLQESGVLPFMSADVACGMYSGTLASGTGVVLSEGEVWIDFIELRDIRRRPDFGQALRNHVPDSWAVVCWPRWTWLNDLSRTDWDPVGSLCSSRNNRNNNFVDIRLSYRPEWDLKDTDRLLNNRAVFRGSGDIYPAQLHVVPFYPA